MLNIQEAEKQNYRDDDVHKDLYISVGDLYLTNEDIVAESLNLTESIESGNNLSFTGCVSSICKFACENIIESIEGQHITVEMSAGNGQRIPIFNGYVNDVTNPDHEEITTQVICYDDMYRVSQIDVRTWYDSLSFPMPMMNFRNALCTRLGIIQVDDYLPNDAVQIYKGIQDKNISGLQLLKYVCEINGRFGQIGRDGKFVYRHLVEATEAVYPAEDLYPADDLFPSDENALESINKAHYEKVRFENYRVSSIDKVQIVNEDGTIGASHGAGDNPFTVEKNPLTYGMSANELMNVAVNLYNTIQGLWYVPSTVDSIGLPYVECGDFVLVAARHSIVRAYVLTRTLKGIQSLKDTYRATGDKIRPIYVPSIEQKVVANSNAITNETKNRETAVRNEASARDTAIRNEASARASGDRENERLIEAETVRAKNVEATKATVDQLNATNANISNLSATVANVNSLVAQKANISELNALRATVNYINAHYVTASQVSTAVHSAMEGTVTCGTLRAGQIKIYTGQGYTDIYNIFRTK